MKRVHAIFIFLLIFMSASLFLKMRSAGTIETSLLALLPQSEEIHSLGALNQSIVRRGTRTVSFLLRSPNENIAQMAGENLISALKDSGMVSAVLFPISPEAQSAWKDLYFPLRYQILSEKDRASLTGNDPLDPLMARLRSALYGSGSLFLMPLIENDPFLFSLEFGRSALSFTGFPSLEDTVFFASVELAIDPFLVDDQDRYIKWWSQIRQQLARENPSLEIFTTGVLPIAQAQRRMAENELFWMGTTSTGLILGLLFALLRKKSLIALLLLPLIFGIVSGLAITLLVFGKIHLLTLTFGTTLIGCAIDYPIHYLFHCIQARRILSARDLVGTIGPGLLMGLATTVIGYGLLTVAPLPGLRQMALFTSSGLISAWIAVVAWLPHFKAALPSPGPSRWQQLIYNWLNPFKEYPGVSRRRTALFFLSLLGISLVALGVGKTTFSDDVRRFNNTPAPLLADQTAIQDVLGAGGGERFVFLSASTTESLLQRQESLAQKLDSLRKSGGFQSLISLAPFLPSVNRQKEDADGLRRLLFSKRATVETEFQKLGLSTKVIHRLYEDLGRPTAPLTIEDWLKHPGSLILRPLWVGLSNRRFGSAMIVQDLKKTSEFEAMISTTEGATFFDPIGKYNELIGRYRQVTMKLLGVAYLFVTLTLVMRYGLRGGIMTALPPLAGLLITTSVFAYMGKPLSIFHVFSFVLVLSMGIDYSVFFMEGARSQELLDSALKSVSLSAGTTLLSFGILGFSSFPPLSTLGVSTFWGLFVSALCSPLPFLFHYRVGDHD